MDIREIEDALENYSDCTSGDGWEFWAWELSYARRSNPDAGTIEGLGRVEFVEQVGGGEGEGEHVHLVLRVGDRYFKKEGYYASYDGTTWDGDFREVKPAEKTIMVYE
jgi:hypothetical protein